MVSVSCMSFYGLQCFDLCTSYRRSIHCLPCFGGMNWLLLAVIPKESYEEALEVSFNVSDKIIRRNDGDVCSVNQAVLTPYEVGSVVCVTMKIWTRMHICLQS